MAQLELFGRRTSLSLLSGFDFDGHGSDRYLKPRQVVFWGFTTNGTALTLITSDGLISIAMLDTGKTTTFNLTEGLGKSGESGYLTRVAFHPSGDLVATSSRVGREALLAVWSVDGVSLADAKLRLVHTQTSKDLGNWDGRQVVRFSPKGTFLAFGANTTVFLWECPCWEVKRQLRTPSRLYQDDRSLSVNLSGASMHRQVRTFEGPLAGLSARFTGGLIFDAGFIHDLCFNETENRLYAGSHGLHVWDLSRSNTAQPSELIFDYSTHVYSISEGPNNELIGYGTLADHHSLNKARVIWKWSDGSYARVTAPVRLGEESSLSAAYPSFAVSKYLRLAVDNDLRAYRFDQNLVGRIDNSEWKNFKRPLASACNSPGNVIAFLMEDRSVEVYTA